MKIADRALRDVVIPGRQPDYKGKVRDLYDLGDALLLVATDRVSAYDVILNEGIPGKGRVLTQISRFWFEKLASIVPSHYLTTDVSKFLGHRNLSTTTRYLNTTSRRLRLALMRVEEARARAESESLANSCKDAQENTPHADDAEAPSLRGKSLVS